MTLNDAISQLSIFSHRVIMKLLEAEKSDIREAQEWIDSKIYQTKQNSEIKKDRCEICNSKEDPKDLEKHHIAGEKHDYRRATVCILDCHRWLSDRQKGRDARWKEKDQPENLRQAFFLLGLQDILALKSIKTGNSMYRKLGELYNEKINVLLGRYQN